MKSRLLKILGTLTFSFAFIIGVACINVHASWEIIPSEDGNILKIHSETPGKLYDDLKHRFGYKYKRIVVTGEMNDFDFDMLCSAARSGKCKSVNIFDVNRDIIPPRSFCDLDDLEEVICPKNAKIIKRICFHNCHNLKKVILHKNLEVIETGAFISCEKLELTLSERVKIGEEAFYRCPKVDFTKCRLIQETINANKSENKVKLLISTCFKFFFK